MDKLILKKRYDYVQVTCRIKEDLLNKVDKIVLENNLYSRNSFINECLKFALNNMKIEEADKI